MFIRYIFHHLFLPLFLSVFIFDCIYSCHQICCFLWDPSFSCCYTASATDLRELFLLSRVFYLTLLSTIAQHRECYRFERTFLISGVFYLTLLPNILHNLFLSKLPWEPIVPPWRLHGLPLGFETQTRLICLFESHSVKQKVLVGRLYLTLYQPLPGF